MAGKAKGWSVRNNRGVLHVRFTWQGKRYDISTGLAPGPEATRRCAKVYSDVVRGNAVKQGIGVARGLDLADLIATWLDESHVSERCKVSYMVSGRKWIRHFGALEHINKKTIRTFWESCLTTMTRCTVLHHLHPLRSFLVWCNDKEYTTEVPLVTLPSRRDAGTKAATTRKADWIILTPAEAKLIINEMPEISERMCRLTGQYFPVRSFFVFLWETGLRESTVYKVEYGVHWRPTFGNKMYVTKEIDKNKYQRWIALTDAAVGAIEAAMTIGDTTRKVVWGVHDYRTQVRKATKALVARLTRDKLMEPKELAIFAEKAINFSNYDLRHSRATNLATSGDLQGLMLQLGWLETSTPARYIHPQFESGAKLMLASVSGTSEVP